MATRKQKRWFKNIHPFWSKYINGIETTVGVLWKCKTRNEWFFRGQYVICVVLFIFVVKQNPVCSFSFFLFATRLLSPFFWPVHRELWSNSSRLTTLASTKNIHGVPINVPFTDLTDLAFTLESTHVHENEDENVRFALAVKVFAYPNRIFSVWVYAISITNR